MSRLWSQARALAGLALLCPIAALGGCGDEADPLVTIDFWAMGREGEVVRELTEAFERANPGIVVRVQQIPWSAAHEKLLTAYAGDAMPDVFQLGNTWVPEFVALDAIAPLDERLAAAPEVAREDFFAGIIETNEIDVRLYGVPWYVDTRLLFYRKDILARAGHPSRRAAGRTGRRPWRPSSRWSERRPMPSSCPPTSGRRS